MSLSLPSGDYFLLLALSTNRCAVCRRRLSFRLFDFFFGSFCKSWYRSKPVHFQGSCTERARKEILAVLLKASLNESESFVFKTLIWINDFQVTILR